MASVPASGKAYEHLASDENFILCDITIMRRSGVLLNLIVMSQRTIFTSRANPCQEPGRKPCQIRCDGGLKGKRSFKIMIN